ncbi:NADP-dependent oxidoreductase [Nocardioides gansuensis]|uniref:NADP-dependent oxidoreductase n=1 Tax=Nocardioides gansuensis TaxID=2138300 RepID=UPI001BAD6399|nr:NADP-dependent oxidoreductase [Nocardioides gansuensis]
MPEPGPDEILVRIHAAGLNPFDWKVADGALEGAVEHSFPLVMGSDGAGVVTAVGSGVTAFRPGDRVYGQFMKLSKGRGSHAEYALGDADGKVATIPDHLSFTLAAALPTATVTAYQAVQAAALQPGHTILVNGASGGVGQSAVQFAAGQGAWVVATDRET